MQIIGRLIPERDSGIYVCLSRIFSTDKSKVYLKVYQVFVLVIKPKRSTKVLAGHSVNLNCNQGYVMQSFFRDRSLFLVWRHNGHLLRNESLNNALISEFQINSLVLKGVLTNFSGNYVCRIENFLNGINWTMTDVDLEVSDINSTWSLLKSPMMWLTQPIFFIFLIKRFSRTKLLNRDNQRKINYKYLF